MLSKYGQAMEGQILACLRRIHGALGDPDPCVEDVDDWLETECAAGLAPLCDLDRPGVMYAVYAARELAVGRHERAERLLEMAREAARVPS